jgi:glyoxylase-like metal-dependent hydrolase (beta-lactamase superfamily II)
MSCGKSIVDDKNGRQIFALEYGTSHFAAPALIQGGKPDDMRPFAWCAWLITGHGKRVLVDTGFDERDTARRWKFDRFESVPDILRRMGVSPLSVTDVVLTHLHWDHAGNIAPYQHARIYLQAKELASVRRILSDNAAEKGGFRRKDLNQIDATAFRGKVEQLAGEREILPGIRVHVGGKHTEAVEWLEIKIGEKVYVLASDNAYLYENIEQEKPTGSTANPRADLLAIRKMKRTATQPALIVPGHDPQVFSRFKKAIDHVVEITGR